MVRAASAEPKLDPVDLMVVSVRDYSTVMKNSCFNRSQELAESNWLRDSRRSTEDWKVLKRRRNRAIIDGPHVPHPEHGWRPDVAFLPSCFEYAPLTPASAEANEIKARESTKVSVYESSVGRIYALVRNEFFWKERAAVWVSLEDTRNDYKEGKVTSYTRIVTDTPEQEIAVVFGLTASRISLRTDFSGSEIKWI